MTLPNRPLAPPLDDRALAHPIIGGVAAATLRAQRQVIAFLFGVFLVLALVGIMLFMAGSVASPRGLWYAMLAALVPTICYAVPVLALDSYEREPWRNLLSAFAWGAVIATLFSILIGSLTSGALRGLLGVSLGERLALVIGAPVIEESLKGLALLGLLLLYRDEFDGILDGLVYSAVIGLGFAMTENMLYLGQAYVAGGMTAFWQLFLARSIFGGLGHAVYTATIGATVGWARLRHGRGLARLYVPVVGWGLAVLQHSLWNTVTTSLRAEELIGGTALRALLFIAPGLLVLTVIALRAREAEQGIVRQELAAEVSTGVLTPTEYAIIAQPRLRHAALLATFQHGGLRYWSLQRHFIQAAAELALCNYHDAQERNARLTAYRCADEYRVRLALLREELVRSARQSA